MKRLSTVHVIQAGADGPAKIAATTSAIELRLGQLQAGNPKTLHLRRLFLGDKELEQDLHDRLRDHWIIDDWFTPVVLDALPDDLYDVPFDTDAHEQRVMIRELARLAKLGGAAR